MFCVCDLALTVYSGMVAKSMNLTPEEVKKDWVAGLLPAFKPFLLEYGLLAELRKKDVVIVTLADNKMVVPEKSFLRNSFF